MSKEPLRTLALYRRVQGRITFGVHLKSARKNFDLMLCEGDRLIVVKQTTQKTLVGQQHRKNK